MSLVQRHKLLHCRGRLGVVAGAPSCNCAYGQIAVAACFSLVSRRVADRLASRAVESGFADRLAGVEFCMAVLPATPQCCGGAAEERCEEAKEKGSGA